MFVRLSMPIRLAPLVLAVFLTGCGPGRNEFPPVCPAPTFLQYLSDLTRYRPDSAGRDLTDLVLRARLTGLQGSCKDGSRQTLETTVSLTMELTRGPAMQGRIVQVPVFVAVTEGDRILNKEVFAVDFEFPPNLDRAAVGTPVLTLNLPVSPEKSGAAYGIIAGFQLTPDELAYNRQRQGR